jgi:hypothetical protein
MTNYTGYVYAINVIRIKSGDEPMSSKVEERLIRTLEILEKDHKRKCCVVAAYFGHNKSIKSNPLIKVVTMLESSLNVKVKGENLLPGFLSSIFLAIKKGKKVKK